MTTTSKPKLNLNKKSLPIVPKQEQASKETDHNHLSLHLAFTKSDSTKRQQQILNSRKSKQFSPPKESLIKIRQSKNESSKQNDIADFHHVGRSNNDSYIFEEKAATFFPYQNLNLKIPVGKANLSNVDKARMIRQMNLKIQLLQSKSKQPGLSLQDLNPLRQQIYNKFDQYYITHRQIRSRFIDTDRTEAENQKPSAFPSRMRKLSKELSPAILKMNSRINSPHASPAKKSLKGSQVKPFSSKKVDEGLLNQNERVNIKTYKTMTDISIISLTNQSNNEQAEQQRPIIETQISEDDLLQLDRQPQRKMSQQSQEHHQSYIQLKENVRIMQERIGFLIHRLEENKKEIKFIRQCKDKLDKKCYEKEKNILSINQQKNQLNNTILSLQVENKKIKEKYEQKTKENQSLEKQILQSQKQICQLTNQIQYLSQKLKLKQNQFATVQELLTQKKGENQQIIHNLRALQRQFNRKKKDLLAQLQDKQQQKQQLKNQLKEHKSRMQVQGINFKFEQAAKLKKYIQENEQLHQRQILKLDSSYSTVINSYQQENRRIKNQKIQLENALIQWLGNYHKLQMQEKELEQTNFKSEVIKLQAIQMQIGDIPGCRISKEFITLLQNYSKLQREKNEQTIKNKQLQTKWRVFKEEYDTIIEQKCDQAQILTKKVNELKSINKILTQQKEDSLIQIKQLQQQLSNPPMRRAQKPKMRQMKIQSKKVNFNYPQNYLALSENGITFLKIMDKLVKVPFKQKLQVALKLIELAQSFGNKKKLPSLNPLTLIVQFNNNSTDFSIGLSKNIKDEEDQNLHYCSPQVLLGFNQTHQSHCWTVGIVLDKLIHGKEYFNQYTQIISRKQNYEIRDDRYKDLQFLKDMLKKNQRQRISLNEAKQRITSFLKISNLQ